MAKKKFSSNVPNKRKRLKTYKLTPFNIHIKGPNRNKGYAELFSKIEKQINRGELQIRPNSRGVVLRILSGTYSEKHNVTLVSILKFNQNNTGLAWDLSKEELITNTELVTAQVVKGFFIHDHHMFLLMPDAHGPTETEIEDYLIKVFDYAAKNQSGQYTIDVKAFKQQGLTSAISTWDVLKFLKIEVFRNNPLLDDVGNQLSDVTEQLEADKFEIQIRSRAKAGIDKDNAQPLIEGADKLLTTGRARVIGEGIKDDENQFIDSKENKTKKMYVKSFPDDDNGLIGQIKESIKKFLGK